MKLVSLTFSFLAVLSAIAPVHALTVDKGVVVFNHTDALMGGVTPGDAAGYPVTISAPGSYRLSGNLQVTANQNGIEVPAAEVTIDLAGFRMIGSGSANIGILGSQRALTVRNGTIRAFALNGIRFNGATGMIDSMRLANNASYGALDAGGSTSVRNSVFSNNGFGFGCVGGCFVESSTFSENGGAGIVTAGGILTGNTIVSNGFAILGSNPVTTNVSMAMIGYGDNTIMGNSAASGGNLVVMSPNACSPAC